MHRQLERRRSIFGHSYQIARACPWFTILFMDGFLFIFPLARKDEIMLALVSWWRRGLCQKSSVLPSVRIELPNRDHELVSRVVTCRMGIRIMAPAVRDVMVMGLLLHRSVALVSTHTHLRVLPNARPRQHQHRLAQGVLRASSRDDKLAEELRGLEEEKAVAVAAEDYLTAAAIKNR